MSQVRQSLLLAVIALAAVVPLLSAQEPKLPPEVKKVTVADGVELHYVEKGKGVPVVFVHGGGGDYTDWNLHLGAFAEHYRAIAYSARYNYPNTNKRQPNYSSVVAAEDLAGLIKKLDLGKVHVVGHSLGGGTALLLAVRHPELVRTLTLSDPGLNFKGDKLPEAVLTANKKARAAFEKGNTEEALEAIFEGRDGGKVKIKEFPEVLRTRLMRNAGEIEALVKGEMFPELDREALKKLVVPTLLVFGEKSPPVFTGIREELMRVLPEKYRKLVIIRGASHGLRWTHAEQYRKQVLEFLRQQSADAGQDGRSDRLPAVFEKDLPVEAFAPTARDGHKGAGFLRKPTGKGPFPAVILLHGGFGGLPAEQVENIALGPWATRYLAAGYVVVAITYRNRAADPQSAEALEDVIAVIEHLRKLPYVDRQSIVLNGFSGGGDLALSVAAATDLAAIVTEEPAGMMFTGVLNKQLLKEGEVYSLWNTEPIRADPKKHYTPECQKLARERIGRIKCPIMIIQGDLPRLIAPNKRDSLTGVNQFNAEITIPELRAAEKTLQVKTYKGEPHG